MTYTKEDYSAQTSTLCTGCGHDSIINHLKSALLDTQTPPHQIVKISGIGCSSKTPAYFAKGAYGFNTIHGRMAPIASGVSLASPELKIIGLSGDGDTASIGLGGFIHTLRRDTPMLYIVANNGVYGLTKGQFSATTDVGVPTKNGFKTQTADPIDLCELALNLNCRFVARSFSGHKKQLTEILKKALAHDGLAFIDIISPCVAFANHDPSTKSYNYVKEAQTYMNELDFISEETKTSTELKLKNISIDISDSTVGDVINHSQSLKKQGYIPMGFFALKESSTKKQIKKTKNYIQKEAFSGLLNKYEVETT